MFREAIESAVKYKNSGEVDFIDEIMSELEVGCTLPTQPKAAASKRMSVYKLLTFNLFIALVALSPQAYTYSCIMYNYV